MLLPIHFVGFFSASSFSFRLPITTSIFVYSYKIEWLHTKCRCCELTNEERKKERIGDHSEDELTHAMCVCVCMNLKMLVDCVVAWLLRWDLEYCNEHVIASGMEDVISFNSQQFGCIYVYLDFHLCSKTFSTNWRPYNYVHFLLISVLNFKKPWTGHSDSIVSVLYCTEQKFHSAKINIYGCAIVDMT